MFFKKHVSPLFSKLFASENEFGKAYVNEFENAIPEGSYLEGEDLISGVGIDRLFSEIFSAVSGNSSLVISFFLLLLGLGLLISLADLSGELLSPKLHSAVRAGVSVIASLLIFERMETLVFSVGENLESLSGFFSALIPIITGISLSSGAVATAGIQAANMNLTLALLGKLSSDFLMPLVFMIFALALTSSLGEGGAAKLAKGSKSVFMWGLGIISSILIASVSMQSFLASSKDGAALRAAKYAISGSIPIVGSTVSGALSTLTGALAEARAFVGVGSIAVIFVMAASPIIIMLAYRLALSVSMWLFDFVGSSGANSVFSAFRSALDALISLYSLSAVVYILEIAIFLRGGVSVFV